MNKYTNRHKRIINQLIKKSFPELKSRKVMIFRKNSEKWLAETADVPFFIIILVDKRIEKLSIKALKGLFAHEIAHIEIISKMSIFEKIKFLKWLWDKKTKIKFESQTDTLVIKKGYGKGLLQLNKEYKKLRTRKQLKERASRGYLSLKQIKTKMKEL